jgi:hypothetical protein
MPAVPQETLINLWYRAKQSELGICIRLAESNRHDIRRMSNLLYNARKAAADESLQEIMLCLPANEQEIFLVRKTVELTNE